jgi:hypothetical protein
MRYQFNAMGFDDRVRAGELAIVLVSSDPSEPEIEELQLYDSQIVRYVERE